MEARASQKGLGISVILITKNEARHIKACLESVSFADEIIVVDSGSTDGTTDIARENGARVYIFEDWPGFGLQKNRALDLATQPWVLSIDADERVTDLLRQEIISAIADPSFSAYQIPRLSEFCEQPIRHSGWWPDYVLRLFKRDVGRFTDAPVHERVVTTTNVGTLKGHLLHFPYPDLDSLITKINRYSSDAANMLAARGKRTSIIGTLGHAIWTFIRIYFLRRGFMDGRYGLILAVTASSGSFFRYAKLMLINDRNRGSRKVDSEVNR